MSSKLWPERAVQRGPVLAPREPSLTHGTTTLQSAFGFVQGPFWTCGSMSNARGAQQAAHSVSLPKSTVEDHSHAGRQSGDASTDISSTLGSLINKGLEMLVSSAIDVSVAEVSPPESELTTVLLETKEQRLQWRDFLSEAVSKSRANSLYASFDVDPSPGLYAKPPPSSVEARPSGLSSSLSPQDAPRANEHGSHLSEFSHDHSQSCIRVEDNARAINPSTESVDGAASATCISARVLNCEQAERSSDTSEAQLRSKPLNEPDVQDYPADSQTDVQKQDEGDIESMHPPPAG